MSKESQSTAGIVDDYSLLGNSLIKPDTGDTADPEEILGGKVVLLYFGASWWQPCLKFTPKLHLFHQLLAGVVSQEDQNGQTQEYEIVFCSMDRSEEEYRQFTSRMSWWCLPYALSTLPRLATIYHAHGMPHLVVIDTDGSVITRSGVDALAQDPVGENFPWRPQRIVDLLPEYYIIEDPDNEDENMLPIADLNDKYLLLYFASKSDSFSQEFTPWLIKAYHILKKQRCRQDFEMIFVSGDDSEASFYTYWSQLGGCAAIPFEEQEAREALENRLEITSYPTLIMLGPKQDEKAATKGDRAIINAEVRAVIENGDYITDFPFYPKPWGDLCKTLDNINDHKCLIVFHEGADDEEEQLDIEDAVKEAAEEFRGVDTMIKFYWAFDAEAPLSSNIREACRLGPPSDAPTMMLLDVRNDGTFYIAKTCPITPANIKFFLLNYQNEEKRQI